MYYAGRIRNVIIFILLCMVYAGIVICFHVGIPCMFHVITGLLCPSCGITHMLIYMAEHDFKSAYESNQMVFVLQPVIYYFVLKNVIAYIKGDRVRYQKADHFLLYLTIVLIFVFFLIRNIVEFIQDAQIQNVKIPEKSHHSIFTSEKKYGIF